MMDNTAKVRTVTAVCACCERKGPTLIIGQYSQLYWLCVSCGSALGPHLENGIPEAPPRYGENGAFDNGLNQAIDELETAMIKVNQSKPAFVIADRSEQIFQTANEMTKKTCHDLFPAPKPPPVTLESLQKEIRNLADVVHKMHKFVIDEVNDLRTEIEALDFSAYTKEHGQPAGELTFTRAPDESYFERLTDEWERLFTDKTSSGNPYKSECDLTKAIKEAFGSLDNEVSGKAKSGTAFDEAGFFAKIDNDRSRWNTTCPSCEAPGYQGANLVECSRNCQK